MLSWFLRLDYVDKIGLYSNANATARLVNSCTTDTKTPLVPLRDPSYQILPGFPHNYEAIETMSGNTSCGFRLVRG